MSIHERAPSLPVASYHPDSLDRAYRDQFVTVIPYHVHPSTLSPAAHDMSKQSAQWPSTLDHRGRADSHIGSDASSPEATGSSLSGSSSGSYSIPRTTWDQVQSYPEKMSGSASFALAPRTEEGYGPNGAGKTNGHTHNDGRARTSWASCPLRLSEGQSARSVRYEEQGSGAVYGGTKEQSSHTREANAVLVLVLLSMPVPLFSIGTCLYTLFALLFLVLSSPLRLCPPTAFFRSTSFSTQLCQLLAPALRYHERLAQKSGHSSSNHHHHHDPYRSNDPTMLTDMFLPARLVLVLLLAPILSLGLLLAVWTAGFFWVFAMILGNPDGTERRDDGRAAVLGVNGWWHKWLSKSRKR